MLAEFQSLNVFLFLLVFARLGAALMVLPGFGEVTISPRVRLVFALALSAIVLPLVSGRMPTVPDSTLALTLLIAGEIFIGFAIGMMARIMVAALQIAGTIIAFHSGMGAATLFDPNAGQQSAMVGAFLTTLGVTLLLVTDLHHVMLMALIDSYSVFTPGGGLPFGDLANTMARLTAESFSIGMRIAMPIVIVALLVYVAMGLIARLMPQIHIFFIALPLQIAIGLAILALTLSAGMALFLSSFADTMSGLWGLL